MQRRKFLQAGSLAATAMLVQQPFAALANNLAAKKRIALVGTGSRGTGFWGRTVLTDFGDVVEFVALCDINPGRAAYAQKRMGITCPLFVNFDEMMQKVKPELVIVTTMDSTHDEFIIKAMRAGADVITEKPMTTDEYKVQAIRDAEKETGRKVLVGFNYRHGPHMIKVKELLESKRVGKLTSVDFNWYLNVYHGSDYFRRWHAYKSKGGSLWVHKATHHFDLLNWWLNSDPVEVSAYGSLDHYGKNSPIRGLRCRDCEHKSTCKFFYDVTKNEEYMGLYVKNEQYDGYFRDGCVFRQDIDIYDKMSAQIIYANGVTVNYSLTTYSPYEGWRIAFNGMNGRMETWQDIPFQEASAVDQSARHANEMKQDNNVIPGEFHEIMLMDNFTKKHEMLKLPKFRGGHGGGDKRMQERMFRSSTDNPYQIMAGTRDGAMSCLIGIAARKSIEQKRPVRIEELTDIKPMAIRPA